MTEMSSGVVVRESEEEKQEDKRVAFVVCCNCILFIIMIILLLMVFTRFSSSDSDDDDAALSPTYRRVVPGSGGNRPTTAKSTSESGGANGTGSDVLASGSTPTMSSEGLTSQTPAVTTLPPVTSSMNMTPFSSTETTTPTTTTTTTRPPPSYENRAFTLICVFEYLPHPLTKVMPPCTDYVYIRFFVYSYKTNQEPVVFEKKKQLDGVAKLYYDNTDELWRRRFGSYRALDNNVKNSKREYPYSRWFLGMWGTAFTRLVASLWDADRFLAGLRSILRSNFSDKITMGDFHGFGIINSMIIDSRTMGRAEAFGKTFRSVSNPILESNWTYIHTAAIWPGGNGRVPEKMIVDMLRGADVIGISTSNTTDEPNIILERATPNTVGYRAASPPNPIRPVAPGTRGMLDILKEFPHWKQVLHKQSLCFSLSTSINYARSSVDPIDFVGEIHNVEDVQRYHRLRFTKKDSATGKLPVEDKQTTYHFDNATYSHFWRYTRNNDLLTFFAYDTNNTLAYKAKEMLDAYGDDKCIVFEDLGEDYEEASFNYTGQYVHFGKMDMIRAVYNAMVNKYGVPFP